jgi:type VI secretion system secreted protein VgrG
VASPSSSIAGVETTVEIRPRTGDAAGRTLDALHVRRFELAEELHSPYRIDLDLVTDESALDVDGLVGADLTLRIERVERDVGHAEGSERVVHGVVLRAWYVGHFADRLHLRVQAGPALALLSSGRRSRVFQGEAVPQLVQRIVEEALEPTQRRVDLGRLARTHTPRDYCVQHRESDLQFVTRILAEEGVTFAFTHDDERETIVLVDDVSGFAGIDASASASGAGQRVVPVGGDRSELGGEESVAALQWVRRVRPAATHATAWDWKSDPPQVLGGEQSRDGAGSDFGEHYAHDERRVIEGPDGAGPHEDRVAESAARAFAAIEAESTKAIGQGNVVAFAAGRTFELEGHPHEAFDRPWLVVRVVHEGDQPEADIDAGGGLSAPAYDNRFEAVPIDRPFAPPLQTKPRIYGHQLATVVGPPAEEIHTDEHGRIKVWFHWDREGRGADPDTSCWLRVAQLWAGPGFGAMFIPRVGMEVVVSFVDGDPDRPLCIGCVYDGKNRPPWALPDERTRSGIKTQSSPGGGGSNELRFEDAAGSEQVYLHAQRDLDEVVERAHTTNVGASQSTVVGADRSLKVGGNRTVTVQGNESITIQGTPKGGAPVGQEIVVIGDIKASATKTYKLVAPLGIDLVCGPTVISMTPQGIKLIAGSGAVLELSAALVAAAAGGAVQLGMDASGKASLASITGAGLEIADTVQARSPSGSKLLLDGQATLAAAGGAKMTLSSAAELAGETTTCIGSNAKLTLGGDAKLDGSAVTVTGGSGKLVADSKGVQLEGPQVQTTAAAKVSILGALVTVN